MSKVTFDYEATKKFISDDEVKFIESHVNAAKMN